MFHHEWYHTKLYKTATHNNWLLKNKIAKILKLGGSVCYQKYTCRNESQALLIERQLIKKYGRRDIGTGILCNMTNGGEGVSGHQRTEEWKEKSRQRNFLSSRGYDQYSLNDEYIRTFNTLNDLKLFYPRIDTGSLSLCVNNKTRSTHGFRWSWKEKPLMCWVKEKQKRPHNGKQFRRVNQYTKDGKYLATFQSLVDGGASIGKHPNTLLECCAGRSKTAGGFVWKYAN